MTDFRMPSLGADMEDATLIEWLVKPGDRMKRGDVIAVRDKQGVEIARGLANYASAEARLMCRKPSSEIEALLGYVAEPEMLHRDNMVLTR